MMLRALIVEQLEADSTLKTFRMQPGEGDHIVVAFGREYAGPRAGPFHFLDDQHAREYKQGFANCRARRLGQFRKAGDRAEFALSWSGIPTERNWLTYYAISLPRFAVPTNVEVTDPHSGRQYRREIYRDDQRKRYVIYLECVSRLGRFDFALACDYTIDRAGFPSSSYSDSEPKCGHEGGMWRHVLDEGEVSRVDRFFETGSRPTSPWRSGSFYLLAIVVVVAAFAAVANSVHWPALPIIFVGALLALIVIGALQLRHDERLADEPFLKLMQMSIKRLPSLLRKAKQ